MYDRYDDNDFDFVFTYMVAQSVSKYRCRDKDDAEYEKLESGCQEGNGDSCSELGACLEFGYGARGNGARAAELYVHACEGGDAYNCFLAAARYSRGQGAEQDRDRAAKFYDRACDLGVTDSDLPGTDGCIKLALMYENGEGLPVDHARAAELYRKGCDHGDGQACFNLAVKHAEGEGVRLDYSRAAELYRESCDHQARNGCDNLGILYAKGQGVPLDRARAAELCRETKHRSGGRFRLLRIHLPQPSRRSRLGPRFPPMAEPGLDGGGVRPELATNLDSAVEESTGSRRYLASEGWPART